mgnify:FL=1
MESNLKNTVNQLKRLFKHKPTKEYIVLCGFEGDPKKGTGFSKREYFSSIDEIPAHFFSSQANLYIWPSTFSEKKVSNDKFSACYALVLDDVVKTIDIKLKKAQIPSDRVKQYLPKASWVIKTSAQSHQVWYLFSHPLDKEEEIAELETYLKALELTDRGANKIRTQPFRIPYGMNGKYNPAFSIKARFSENLYHPIKDLLIPLRHAYQNKQNQSIRSKLQHYKPTVESGSDVFKPAPAENPVVESLKERGYYVKSLNDGGHAVKCPWSHLHSDGREEGAVYYEPTQARPLGAFHCPHDHCSERTISDLLNELHIDKCAAKCKSAIILKPNHTAEICNAIDIPLAVSGDFYRDENEQVVKLKHVSADSHIMTIGRMEIHELQYYLSQQVNFIKYQKDIPIERDPSDSLLAKYLNCHNHPNLPVIKGVSYSPVFIKGKGFVVHEGYDPDTKYYGFYKNEDFAFKRTPDRAEAEEALAKLRMLLSEFLFDHDFDEAAALCLILTAVIRRSLPTAPFGLVTAPDCGSGKTYLTELSVRFNSPNPTEKPATHMDTGEKAFSSELFAVLLGLPSFIKYDNITTDIKPYASLCAVLTQESYKDRRLGVSVEETVPTNVFMVGSGNNIEPTRDMIRRTLQIRLNTNMENPTTRQFKHTEAMAPVERVERNPAYWQKRVMIIIQAYLNEGVRVPCSRINGFDVWSYLTREPLIWLGLPDPATRMLTAITNNTEKQLLGSVLKALARVFNGKSFKAVDIVPIVYPEDGKSPNWAAELIEETSLNGSCPSVKSLGRWLARYVDTIADGHRLVISCKKPKSYKIERIGTSS